MNFGNVRRLLETSALVAIFHDVFGLPRLETKSFKFVYCGGVWVELEKFRWLGAVVFPIFTSVIVVMEIVGVLLTFDYNIVLYHFVFFGLQGADAGNVFGLVELVAFFAVVHYAVHRLWRESETKQVLSRSGVWVEGKEFAVFEVCLLVNKETVDFVLEVAKVNFLARLVHRQEYVCANQRNQYHNQHKHSVLLALREVEIFLEKILHYERKKDFKDT